MTTPSECPFAIAAKRPGMHSFIVDYRRPWFLCWRKVFAIRCWECDLIIMEPAITIAEWERKPRR